MADKHDTNFLFGVSFFRIFILCKYFSQLYLFPVNDALFLNVML